MAPRHGAPSVCSRTDDSRAASLMRSRPLQTVLVVKKIRDRKVIAPFVQLIDLLINDKKMSVIVETSGSIVKPVTGFKNVQFHRMTIDHG